MGADLITATLVKPTDCELNWSAAHEAIDKMTIDDFDECLIHEVYFIERAREDELLSMLRELAHESFHEVEYCISNQVRSLNVYENFMEAEFDLFVIGGTSWGDIPVGCDSFIAVACCPAAATAAGFLEPGML